MGESSADLRSWIGKTVTVHLDRPLGSRHPKFPDCVYTCNYGYLPGTRSDADGEEIDAYVLGPTVPLKTFHGTVVAVIQRPGGGEIKLVVTDGRRMDAAGIEAAVGFQERYHRHQLVL